MDCSRDAGRSYRYCHRPDIDHDDFTSAASPESVRCWDSVPKLVRNETPSTTGSASGTSTAGSTPSTGAGSTSSATGPPEAAGLPDCGH
jgi:hypothetical protein